MGVKQAAKKGAAKGTEPAMAVGDVVAWLKRSGTRKTIDGMARYGIPSTRALGVTMAALVDEPEKVTLAQMDAWVAGFDNWAGKKTAGKKAVED